MEVSYILLKINKKALKKSTERYNAVNPLVEVSYILLKLNKKALKKVQKDIML